MKNKSILALVVSSSGSLQDGLLALMTTIPQINVVLVAEDANSALRMIENHQPALIILDISLIKVQDVIEQIKAQSSHIYLIVLVKDVAQQKKAETSGADSVLVKGFSVQKLIGMIENLIDQWEGSFLAQANVERGTNTD
jgi:DNA-binding response OmpR family regulator